MGWAQHTTRLAKWMVLHFASQKSTTFCKMGGDALKKSSVGVGMED